MEAAERIRNHPYYKECYEKLEKAEQKRSFCRHQMPHLLDVARIAYIRNLEEGLCLKKDVIYAAALLHDIGKYRQYEDGTPHELAGATIAEKILKDTGVFTEKEEQEILQAVLVHRKGGSNMTALGRLLYESDKLSRACYACPVENECSWGSNKKNMEIKW